MAESLKQKTVKGIMWNALQKLSSSGIAFLLTLVMARLLSPSDYGMIGLLTVFIAVASIFVDCGFSMALVRKKVCSQEDRCTVFFWNIFISVVAYIILFFIAPCVASFYDMPLLCPLLRVVSLKIVIGSFTSIQSVNFTIALDFKTTTRITIINSLASGFFGIAAAVVGMGVWALVIQQISGAIISCFQYWHASPWRPSWVFSKQSFRYLFGFGSNMLMSQLLETVYTNIYPIVIGKVFDADSLGHYSRAHTFASFPAHNITHVLSQVTFPVLAKIQDEDDRLRTVYRKILRVSSFVVFPLLLGLSALAQPLIIIIIGEKWLFCAQLLQVVCFSMMWYPVHAINLNLLKVKGRSDLFFKLEVIKKFLGVVILIVSIPFGVMGMCYFGILSSLISLGINTYYTGKLINLGFYKQMLDLLPILITSVLMFVVIIVSVYYVPNVYVKLLTGVVVGTFFYIGVTKWMHFDELKELVSILKGIKK